MERILVQPPAVVNTQIK